ncbi:hypothetical protein LCGC14_0642900 [marine sediment metagenome]|uniref:DNA methylase N-4/N-6 domain-containing protein n=1 Tax=marine sediment metagenome TaxID=412755 RepID=A0A0F9U736_9ZZZZ
MELRKERKRVNKHKLICTDWLDGIQVAGDDYYAVAFADPPDNIGVKYDGYDDNLPAKEYFSLLSKWVRKLVEVAGITWFSYNAKWAAEVGTIVNFLVHSTPGLEKRHMVQTYTFYQHNQHDLGNGHRPIWRLRWRDAPLYPNQIRVESERQKSGDKRADPRGKVPSDCFDFPRVTGNSRQRRSWSPTQLHEGLIERCVKLSTKEGDRVLDPFGGTGSILRVCRRINRVSTTFEISPAYSKLIANDNAMAAVDIISPSTFLRCRTCRAKMVKLHESYVSCVEGCNKVIPLQDQTSCYVLD